MHWFANMALAIAVKIYANIKKNSSDIFAYMALSIFVRIFTYTLMAIIIVDKIFAKMALARVAKYQYVGKICFRKIADAL